MSTAAPPRIRAISHPNVPQPVAAGDVVRAALSRPQGAAALAQLLEAARADDADLDLFDAIERVEALARSAA